MEVDLQTTHLSPPPSGNWDPKAHQRLITNKGYFFQWSGRTWSEIYLASVAGVSAPVKQQNTTAHAYPETPSRDQDRSPGATGRPGFRVPAPILRSSVAFDFPIRVSVSPPVKLDSGGWWRPLPSGPAAIPKASGVLGWGAQSRVGKERSWGEPGSPRLSGAGCGAGCTSAGAGAYSQRPGGQGGQAAAAKPLETWLPETCPARPRRGRLGPQTSPASPGDAAASGAPRTAVPYHRGEILHGLGFSLCHLPGSQLGGAVSDRHLHFHLSAQMPRMCVS